MHVDQFEATVDGLLHNDQLGGGVQTTSLDTRGREKVIYQRGQVVGLTIDRGDKRPPLLFAERLPALCQEPGETDDRDQRRAQIMGCGGGEAPDGFVDRLQFSHGLLDPDPFDVELVIDLVQFCQPVGQLRVESVHLLLLGFLRAEVGHRQTAKCRIGLLGGADAH